MSIINILYTIVIGPLELLFDVIFSLAYIFTKNAGVSIIVLSACINVLLLPLYNRADSIQKEQNEKEKQLKPWIDHIKKSFKGDERYMILQTYYKQNQYKPTDVLKSSLSLLLQIPFFIAAYNYLSGLGVIKGSSFFFINDLSMPDNLLSINGISINVLPIAMTIINIISGIIYLKNQPLKSKIQAYGLAIVFLVFLYNRPSGLVMYWTLNNLFSLTKNIIHETKNAKRVSLSLCSFIGICGIIYAIIRPFPTLIQELSVIFVCIVLQIPILFSILFKNKCNDDKVKKINSKLFILLCLFLCLFTGAYIPSTVISSSTYEFVSTITLTNPNRYLINNLLLSFGLFVFWLSVYYFLLDNKIKLIMEKAMASISVVSIIDFMFFGTQSGRISNLLLFDTLPIYSNTEIFFNVILMAVVFVSIYILSNKSKLIEYICFAIIFVCLTLSTINYIRIDKEAKEAIDNIVVSNKDKAEIKLSKDEKNVIIIILDRAIGSYFPYIVNEDSQLLRQFEGFTYYPNTLSFGDGTAVAMPAVYGGYEYSPEKINERKSETKAQKYNEASLLMPRLFSENGYDATIFDPAISNASFKHDISIYENLNRTNSYITEYGMYKIDDLDVETTLDDLKTYLFRYSIMKIAPLFARNYIYNSGAYLSIDKYNYISDESPHINKYISQEFINSYAVLKNLTNITTTNSGKNNFLLLCNHTTHENTVLGKPGYIINSNINNTKYDNEYYNRKSAFDDSVINLTTQIQQSHYDVNMVALKELGNWFDYLRKNGVYDNTRIIVVSDHSKNLNQFKNWYISDNNEEYDLMKFNPLFLYKDFNSKEFNINNDLMFNADTLSLAIDGLIDNPINPYTGEHIEKNVNKEKEKIFVSNRGTQANEYEIINGYWYTVNKNIFDKNNWKKVEE